MTLTARQNLHRPSALDKLPQRLLQHPDPRRVDARKPPHLLTPLRLARAALAPLINPQRLRQSRIPLPHQTLRVALEPLALARRVRPRRATRGALLQVSAGAGLEHECLARLGLGAAGGRVAGVRARVAAGLFGLGARLRAPPSVAALSAGLGRRVTRPVAAVVATGEESAACEAARDLVRRGGAPDVLHAGVLTARARLGREVGTRGALFVLMARVGGARMAACRRRTCAKVRARQGRSTRYGRVHDCAPAMAHQLRPLAPFHPRETIGRLTSS